MPVTDHQTNSAMAQAKSRLSRSLLLCFVAMLVIGMSFAGVASAQTTDSLEPNDQLSSATDVGSGAEYSDVSIDSSTDVDYYAVDVEEGERITADIFFDHTDGDIDLELQDSDGSYLTSSISVSDDESVEYVAEESGTYYVQVYGFSGATAEYDIDIATEEIESTEQDSLEPNDDLSSATELGSGGSYDDLEVSSDVDSDYFRVDADAGDTISADIFFDDDEGDVDLELQDEDGYYLDGSYSVSDDESVSYTVSESGYYYIEVYSYSGAPTSYDIDVSTEESEDQIEDGADLRSISLGETVEGTIDASDPTVETYLHEPVTFTGESGQVVDISMTSETGDTYLVLESPDGEYVTFDDDGGDDLNSLIEGYELQQNGEYTIIATSFSGSSTFDYTLTLEEGESDDVSTGDSLEPNDDLSSATELGSGGSYDDLEVSSYDDSDYFAVEADAGDTITADIFFFDDEGDVDLELQDEDGYYLDGSYSVSDDESITYTVDESGTYYIEVYSFSGAPTSYDIDVSTNGTGTVDGDSLEPNDDLSSATELGSGGSYDDLEVSSYDDSDYFRVYADAGDTISADIFFDDDEGDVDLELQDGDGYYLEGSTSVTDDEGLTYTVDESGYYYVEVYPWSGAPTSYDIDVSTDATGSTDGDLLEPNDDLSSATYLGNGGSYDDLEASSYEDSDYFEVYADAGDTISADIFFDDDEGDVDLELQDSTGAELTDSISTTDDESITYTVDESGTYYVEVYPFSGAPTSYDIDVSVDDSGSDDDQIQDGTDLRSLSYGETAEGTIDMSDPTVEGYYHEPVSFYGQAGTTVNIDMSSEEGDTYLVLEGPDGSYLTYDDDGGDGLNSQISDYELEQTGTYTIIATSYSGSSTFDYELSLNADGSNSGGVQTNEDLSLSANSTATAGGDMLVEFSLENTGSEAQAVILQAGDGVDQLGSGYSVSDHSDDGGNWRSSESSWLFESLSGEVNPTMTIDVPEDAQGEQYMTVVAESDEGNVSTTVVLNLDDIGIVQAADTNDNGELSDSEILAAIEAWRTDSTIEGTDTMVSDQEIINLISTWRAEGS